MAGEPLTINGMAIAPGSRVTIDLPVASLYTHAPMTMPVQVLHGRRAGPRLFVCAAIHGDEINGVEIIRRLLKLPVLAKLRGTLLAVPIVNVYGFVHRSRYLPDRRDLNRSFPGSDKGSLAGRLAHLFLQQIVGNSTHGIDLHTAAQGRQNLPQVRVDLRHDDSAALAQAFGAPVVLDSILRDGSLRAQCGVMGVPILVYEAGEALRFDEVAIRAGVLGIVRVMRSLGMLVRRGPRRALPMPTVARQSIWVRASQSGILRASVPLGRIVPRGALLGRVADPFGEQEVEVCTSIHGMVIGRSTLPLVHEGEALFHIARIGKIDVEGAMEHLEAMHTEEVNELAPDMPQEPPIV